jgi:hypothetical protein
MDELRRRRVAHPCCAGHHHAANDSLFCDLFERRGKQSQIFSATHVRRRLAEQGELDPFVRAFGAPPCEPAVPADFEVSGYEASGNAVEPDDA